MEKHPQKKREREKLSCRKEADGQGRRMEKKFRQKKTTQQV